jgi:hypothetical protein
MALYGLGACVAIWVTVWAIHHELKTLDVMVRNMSETRELLDAVKSRQIIIMKQTELLQLDGAATKEQTEKVAREIRDLQRQLDTKESVRSR